jgi:galactokinase
MTGAGFGGCTIAIVKTAQKDEFKQYVVDKYEGIIGYKPTCYEADIADGIRVKEL